LPAFTGALKILMSLRPWWMRLDSRLLLIFA
jgi:hypothetical protein